MTPWLPRPQPWSADQRGVMIALLIALTVYLGIRFIVNPVFVADPQPPASPRAAELQDRIDPNTAGWAALAALPMIGEKRARDIVAFRDQYQADHPGQLAFSIPADMLRVRGIGAGMLSTIEPFLIFPPGPASPATQP